VSLRTPDASQIDVINDLLMFKSHSRDKNASRSQSTAYTKPNIGTAGEPYQVTSVKEAFGTTGNFQSITSMEVYAKQSFEVKEYCR